LKSDHPFIKKLLALPDDKLLTSRNLVDLGIGGSETRLYHMRKHGSGPPYVVIPERTYLYAINDVIQWLRSCQRSQPIDDSADKGLSKQ
jgi:hypothetical protein